MVCESCLRRDVTHVVTFGRLDTAFDVCGECALDAVVGGWSAANPLDVARVDVDAPVAFVPRLMLVR